MTVRLIKSPRVRRCLGCDAKLPLFHVLLNRRFCSTKHEREHMEELSTIAMARLEESDARFRRLAEPVDLDTPATLSD